MACLTGPRSAVGNVSGYRCVSDCNPGVASSIPAQSHTFVEIDNEIISTVILLPSADSFKKGCCQLQAKVCARITGYPLVQACPGKSVVRRTDRPAMTIAVDLGRKATKQTKNKSWPVFWCLSSWCHGLVCDLRLCHFLVILVFCMQIKEGSWLVFW